MRGFLDSIGEWLKSKGTKHAAASCVPLVIGGVAGAVPWHEVVWGCAGAFGLAGAATAVKDAGKGRALIEAKVKGVRLEP